MHNSLSCFFRAKKTECVLNINACMYVYAWILEYKMFMWHLCDANLLLEKGTINFRVVGNIIKGR